MAPKKLKTTKRRFFPKKRKTTVRFNSTDNLKNKGGRRSHSCTECKTKKTQCTYEKKGEPCDRCIRHGVDCLLPQ